MSHSFTNVAIVLAYGVIVAIHSRHDPRRMAPLVRQSRQRPLRVILSTTCSPDPLWGYITWLQRSETN